MRLVNYRKYRCSTISKSCWDKISCYVNKQDSLVLTQKEFIWIIRNRNFIRREFNTNREISIIVVETIRQNNVQCINYNPCIIIEPKRDESMQKMKMVLSINMLVIFFVVIILEGDQVRICNKSSYTTFLTPAKGNKHIF